MHAKREPELQRPERPGVLERDVGRVVLLAVVRQIGALVAEGGSEVGAVANEDDAARLRQVEPLVRVDRDRVGELDASKERFGRRDAGSRQAVGTVDVQPDPPLPADVGERVDRVDGAGERRAGGGDDRHRHDARREVGVDRPCDRLGPKAAALVDREPANVVRPDPEQLGRADDGVVHLLGAVDRERAAGDAGLARAGKRAFAGCGERGEVRNRPATRERARLRRIADELARPAHRLQLDLRGGAGPDGEVGVVAGGERIGDHADLEARRADESEVARPRLGDALVERLGRVGDGGFGRRAARGKRLLQKRRQRSVDRRLPDAKAVEAPPGFPDHGRCAGERLLA